MDTTPAHSPTPARPAPQWHGAASASAGLLAFSGRIGGAAPHAHAAVQVLLLASGGVTLVDPAGHAQEARSAIIPAGVPHELRASVDAGGLVAYLDPAGPAGRAADALLRATGLDPATARAWRAAAQALPGVRTVDELVGVLHTPPAPLGTLPEPLRQALALAPRLIDGPLLLGELAGRVGLSASRLGHLFAEHLRLPYPAWRRWARLLHALESVQSGASLTTAAHAAGFTDSAHLTRACRAMFGIPPSEALAATGLPPTRPAPAAR
ncbi:putative transcriptional regulator, AraC family protein [Streptomyces lucensis JCM 4490]|uniref:Transcriptional regulator, AraC family protein n=1 Tax=Streptomyces lucensis JCM 4490 TaxID=1306176 RepID=A0A918JB79_9ACTN|nr:AraC family transcriptional regulator [Streptomyces lucensis]GGW71983.1 putative transcriptional regulator, AraC family protein [Streptomyces lucensis JCM 4490]